MTDSSFGAAPTRAQDFRLGDVFGRSFELLARRLVPFLALTFVAYLPSYLVAFLLDRMGASDPSAMSVVGVLAFLTGGLAALVSSTLASAAVTYGVVQELRGQPFEISEAFSVALRRVVPLIGVALCVGLFAGLALLLLIVPGVIVICTYYIAGPACIVERLGVFASMSRSAALTKGHRWQIFGIVLVFFLASAAISGVLALVLAGLESTPRAIVTGAWEVFFAAFNAVLVGVLYFRLRTAKEGLDIDQIARVFD